MTTPPLPGAWSQEPGAKLCGALNPEPRAKIGFATVAKDLTIGLSLANLCAIRVWAELLSRDVSTQYYLKIADADFVAAILTVLCLGLALTAGVALARRIDRPLVRAAARWAFLLLLLIPLNELRRHVPGWEMATVLKPARHTGWALIGILCVLGTAFAVIRWQVLVARAVATVVLCLAPFTAVTFARAAWTLVHDRPSTSFADKPLAPRLPDGPDSAGRVLLLVFDGLDQRLAFTERPPGLDLPELDRLRAEAVWATHALPPGTHTGISLPVLTTGVLIEEATPAGPDELLLTVADGEEPVGWSTRPTLFTKARALGFNTALVGWYHPYCRVLKGATTFCSWQPAATASQGGDTGLLLTMRDQLWSLSPWYSRAQHLRAYRRILRDAKTVVADRGIGFALLHIPVPHEPWIYDRAREAFTLNNVPVSGYLDNLALADRTLGELRATMEEAGTWATASILVTSDHAWRLSHRFDGRRDPRVPCLIKLAGQREGLTYEPAFNTVALHDLTMALLRGDVLDERDVVDWLDERLAREGAARVARGSVP